MKQKDSGAVMVVVILDLIRGRLSWMIEVVGSRSLLDRKALQLTFLVNSFARKSIPEILQIAGQKAITHMGFTASSVYMVLHGN